MEKFELFRISIGIRRKWLIAMKTFFLLFFVFSIHLNASVLSQQRVSLNMNGVSVKKLIKEIEAQTNLGFIYNLSEIEKLDDISIDVEQETVKKVLDEVLTNTDLTYELNRSVIIIMPRQEEPITNEEKQQEKKIIKGTITDNNGVPLPGVSIVVKGTSVGTATNVDGEYTLELEREKSILIFSFVGMVSKEIAANANTVVNVTLDYDTEGLDEVVVTGYQEVKKERITGSIETINVDEIADKPYASVDQLLTGKVSGLASFMSSGQAGKNAEIRIRGINTLSGSTQPLWIIDGLPLQGEVPNVSAGGSALEANILNNGIGNIPASDIKSITVLKDAAAAAIYGARAANGVIIITTKGGHDGDIYANFNASLSFSQAPKQDLDFMNTTEKIIYERDLFEDFNGDSRMTRRRGGRVYKILHDVKTGKISNSEGDRLINELGKHNTNWFDEIFENSISKSYGVNISGGNKKITYYFSANKLEEEGVLKNDKYDNTSIRAKGSYKPNDKFDVVFGLNTTIRNKEYHNSYVNPFKYATYANPYERAYDDNGNMAYDNTYLRDSYKTGLEIPKYGTFNILNEINNTGANSKYTSTGASVNLRYYILKELRLSSKYVKTNTQKHISEFAKPGTYTSFARSWYKEFIENGDLNEEDNLGYYTERAVFSDEYSFNNTLEYSKEFDNKFYTSILIGQEISVIKTNDFYTYMPEYYPEYDIVGYPNIDGVEGKEINLVEFGNKGFKEKRYSSFFSSFTAGYADKYILNFNARYDGADIIGDAERFTPLWSASGRWNVHKEDFFNSVSFIDELSLKGEYGFTGNINRDAFPFTTITLSGTNRYKGILVATNYSYPNPAIKWEQKEEKSFGVSSSMFNYRFNYNFNYYYNTVSDVLAFRRLPVSAGVTRLVANVSDLLNTGYEVSVNFVPVKHKDFQLSLHANVAYNKNKVSNAFYSDLNALKLTTLLGNYQPYVSGYAVGTVFGLINKGINSETGDQLVEVNRAQIKPFTTPDGPVDYAIETIDRDKVSLDYDRATKLGVLNPVYTGGFGLAANYKNWELNTNFTFEAGHIIPKFAERLSSPYKPVPTDYSKVNVLKNKLNRWRQPGDVTDVRRFDLTNLDSYKTPLDTDFEKGDYIKLKNIILSYRLPNEILKKANIGVNRLKFSLQADNLFTLTEYSGIDPETRNDFGYPVPRTYRFALNIGF
jgi:TonB-linked SusC/RagA family outer membrane protein